MIRRPHEELAPLSPCLEALRAGDRGAALAALDQLALTHPRDPGVELLAGQIALDAGDEPLAELRLLRSALFGEGSGPLIELAAVAFKSGALRDAARYLEHALARARPPGLPAPRLSAPAVHTDRTPTVAVGLPVYSGGEMLAGAIEAVLAQDFGDLELTIFDTGDDPHTQEVCRTYAALDPRVRHFRNNELIGYVGTKNNVAVMQRSGSPFYMWASYDDRHAPSFVRKALVRMREDAEVGLVYSMTRLLGPKGDDRGIAPDDISALDDDPAARVLRVVRCLSMCNAWYGLFRRSVLHQTRSLQRVLYRSYDNVFLAEIALLSKIARLPEVLFTRGLTRPRPRSYEAQNADVIASHHPGNLREGVTLPMVRLVWSHVDLIHRSALPRHKKCALLGPVVAALRDNLGARMSLEIERTLNLLGQRIYYQPWGEAAEPSGAPAEPLDFARLVMLRQRLTEAAFIYPERADLQAGLRTCDERLAAWRGG